MPAKTRRKGRSRRGQVMVMLDDGKKGLGKSIPPSGPAVEAALGSQVDSYSSVGNIYDEEKVSLSSFVKEEKYSLTLLGFVPTEGECYTDSDSFADSDDDFSDSENELFDKIKVPSPQLSASRSNRTQAKSSPTKRRRGPTFLQIEVPTVKETLNQDQRRSQASPQDTNASNESNYSVPKANTKRLVSPTKTTTRLQEPFPQKKQLVPPKKKHNEPKKQQISQSPKTHVITSHEHHKKRAASPPKKASTVVTQVTRKQQRPISPPVETHEDTRKRQRPPSPPKKTALLAHDTVKRTDLPPVRAVTPETGRFQRKTPSPSSKKAALESKSTERIPRRQQQRPESSPQTKVQATVEETHMRPGSPHQKQHNVLHKEAKKQPKADDTTKHLKTEQARKRRNSETVAATSKESLINEKDRSPSPKKYLHPQKQARSNSRVVDENAEPTDSIHKEQPPYKKEKAKVRKLSEEDLQRSQSGSKSKPDTSSSASIVTGKQDQHKKTKTSPTKKKVQQEKNLLSACPLLTDAVASCSTTAVSTAQSTTKQKSSSIPQQKPPTPAPSPPSSNLSVHIEPLRAEDLHQALGASVQYSTKSFDASRTERILRSRWNGIAKLMHKQSGDDKVDTFVAAGRRRKVPLIVL